MIHTNWPKCPLCKSQNVRIKEFWIDHAIEWNPDDSQDEGILSPGFPYRVEGRCLDCDHAWYFRCGGQIKSEWWEADAEIDSATDEVIRHGEDEELRRGG